MNIVEVKDLSGFFALEKEWKNVLNRCNHSVFSTFEWLTCWWKHYGIDKRLVILLAESDNEIAGIAPLMYSVHRMFGARMGKIEFIGTPHSDYNDFLLVHEEEACVANFISYLGHSPFRWSCIELVEIPQNSKSLRILGGASKRLKAAHRCPYTPLPESYETFLEGLNHKKRNDLRRNLKRLEKEFEVNFVDYSRPESCIKGMNEFFILHQLRWRSKGYLKALPPRDRSFSLEISRFFSSNGWLRLYLLELSGKPVGALYGFGYGGKFYYYLSGFDPRYSRYSVGNLLVAKAIEKSIEEGLSEFDFLRGDEDYKDRWNTMGRWNHEAILIKKSHVNDFQYLLADSFWKQGGRLKYVVRNAPRTLAQILKK